MAIRIGTSDEYVFEQIFLDLEYKIDVPRPKTLLDAGANIGLASVWFANQFPDADIVAIEPDPSNFRVLKENAAAYRRIRCLQVGLWHRNAMLERISEDAQPWAYRYQETSKTAQRNLSSIESVGLDDVVNRFFEGSIDLLKMDIEGAEKEILAVGGQWTNRVQTAMIECHDRWVPGCEKAMEERFPSDKFDARQNGENTVFVRRAISDATANSGDQTFS
ncbi:FkbM family methyltransferase [Rhodopirellula europaea]|uniref:FkbM family methyltransferase n=1 Tax=Rhodopirellula europaea 6C TaxID=1263867 RepID=M2B907_9BACT|nr:FkbM family methyltransferase [Rhodopirellula europaea]EMB18188.1 FkbM family methyltransferase [Rhodopirellula europaea 6C]